MSAEGTPKYVSLSTCAAGDWYAAYGPALPVSDVEPSFLPVVAFAALRMATSAMPGSVTGYSGPSVQYVPLVCAKGKLERADKVLFSKGGDQGGFVNMNQTAVFKGVVSKFELPAKAKGEQQ